MIFMNEFWNIMYDILILHEKRAIIIKCLEIFIINEIWWTDGPVVCVSSHYEPVRWMLCAVDLYASWPIMTRVSDSIVDASDLLYISAVGWREKGPTGVIKPETPRRQSGLQGPGSIMTNVYWNVLSYAFYNNILRKSLYISV